MEEKTCSKCSQSLPKSCFGIVRGYYLRPQCNSCRIKDTQERGKTTIGLARRIYSHQKQRSIKNGYNAPSYGKDEFVDYLLNSSVFLNLHDEWVRSGYKNALVPSVDRLDDYKGYSFDNIRIVTWAENSEKYQIDRVSGINNKQNCAVLQFDSGGFFVAEYHSQKEAFRVTGILNTQISVCCKRKDYTANGFYWRYKREYVGKDFKTGITI